MVSRGSTHLRTSSHRFSELSNFWGGCTVSLVRENEVEEFKKKLNERYSKYQGVTEEELNETVFATKPSSGAFGMFLVFGSCQDHRV
jgi:hypothetical protein